MKEKTTPELIKFPEPNGTTITHTGEGGISVYAVWTENNHLACHDDMIIGCIGNVLIPPQEMKAKQLEQQRHYKQHAMRSGELGRGTLPALTKIADPEFEALKAAGLYDEHDRYHLQYKNSLVAELRNQETIAGASYTETLWHGQMPHQVKGIINLGSTDQALYVENPDNEDENEYFRATEADLTEEGHQIIETLNQLYGSEAQYLTALDT